MTYQEAHDLISKLRKLSLELETRAHDAMIRHIDYIFYDEELRIDDKRAEAIRDAISDLETALRRFDEFEEAHKE